MHEQRSRQSRNRSQLYKRNSRKEKELGRPCLIERNSLKQWLLSTKKLWILYIITVIHSDFDSQITVLHYPEMKRQSWVSLVPVSPLIQAPSEIITLNISIFFQIRPRVSFKKSAFGQVCRISVGWFHLSCPDHNQVQVFLFFSFQVDILASVNMKMLLHIHNDVLQ